MLRFPAVVMVFRSAGCWVSVIAILTVVRQFPSSTGCRHFFCNMRSGKTAAQKIPLHSLLRQQNLELLILFGLYLVALLSIRFTGPLAIESDLVYPAAVTVHRMR